MYYQNKSKKRKLRKAVYSLKTISVNRIERLFFIVAIFSVSVLSQTHSPDLVYHGQTVWDLPKIAEDDIDIGLWALIVAKEFDNSVDVVKYSTKLDSIVLQIRLMLANRTNDRDYVTATKMFLYDSGKWNNFHRYDYDLDDPLGRKPENRFINTFLDTRKGSCISMPTLFYALLKCLDPSFPICGVVIPRHMFCRIKDRQTGDLYNFEATRGTPSRNVWYIEQSHIAQKGIDSGIYMRDLSKKEFLGGLITLVMQKYRGENKIDAALKYADLALELDPRDIVAIVNKCAMNAELAFLLDKKKEKNGKLSVEESKLFKDYCSTSKAYEEKAISLGWQSRSEKEAENYLEFVKDEKDKRSQQR
jgi:regulator of sirC expression with transglutaminase-like and TPR domain